MAPPVLQSVRWARAEEHLADLIPTCDVVRLLMAEFVIAEKTAYLDVRAARDRWTAESAKGRPQKREEMHARLRRLERMARDKGDLSTALKALALASDLDGLRQKGDGEGVGALTPEEREAMQRDLAARPTPT